MIPTDSNDIIVDFEIKEQPSNTFQLEGNSTCDGIEALKQAIYLILNVERYKYLIYSWNYGIELQDLFGKPKTYVIPELERRIKEALMQDDRITGVDNFTFESSKGSIFTRFTVHSVFGDIDSEKEVSV